MIILLCILFIATVMATVGVFLFKQKKKETNEIFRIKEIPMTALLGFLLWMEAGIILYYSIVVPEVLIKSSRSYWNVVIFLALSIILGAIMLLYYSVKCCIVNDEGFQCVSLVGSIKEIRWNEISEVKLTIGKRLMIETKTGVKVTVGGEKKDFQRFRQVARQKIKHATGMEVLNNL